MEIFINNLQAHDFSNTDFDINNFTDMNYIAEAIMNKG
ncbi:hypothetical protein B712_0613 [Chlamydia psittaci NJ1]|nr:hypothetical protein B712_0613 [Chlamydia psittaci NJ1]